MLEVAHLECSRGERRLFTALHFALEPGALLHVQGHNGSGKTTLLRAVCGLLQPQAGTIHWEGVAIATLGEDYRREVLYLGHLNGIKPDLTAIENLRVATTLAGAQVAETPEAALAQLGLAEFADLPTRVLSQGQKKRVALARLPLSHARLWILDEPFTALDPNAVAQVQTLLTAHLAGGGMVLVTTHQEVPLTAGTLHRLRLGN